MSDERYEVTCPNCGDRTGVITSYPPALLRELARLEADLGERATAQVLRAVHRSASRGVDSRQMVNVLDTAHERPATGSDGTGRSFRTSEGES